MSVLRASGSEFDVDRFLEDSPWKPAAVFRRGESRTPSGLKRTVSGFNLSISDAGFDKFAEQQIDAISFLSRHTDEIARLITFAGVDGAVLDFGVAWRDVAAQSDTFSADLVRLAGACGLSLELSHYHVSQPAAG
ncbi:MAG: hypothetical protein ACTHM6_18500 [Tepidisphaeraceae bacterium]